MSQKQPSKVTQVNETKLTPEQQQLMQMGMEQFGITLGQGTPQLPTVAGFDPEQVKAQEGVLAKSSGMLGDMSGNLASAQNFLMGDVMDINKNPHLAGAIDAAIRPITENYQAVVAPTLRTGAVSAGALGSHKPQQRAQVAANQYMREVGDTSSKLANDAYKSNLDAMVRGVALAPQSMSASLFPEVVQEGVGAQRRQLQVDQSQRDFAQQMLPFSLGQSLISASAGAPGAGSSSTVTPATPQNSMWSTLLGSGLGAAGMLLGLI